MTPIQAILSHYRSKGITRAEKDALMFLACHLAKHPLSHLSFCAMSQASLVSRRTVASAIRKAEALGLLIVTRNRRLLEGRVVVAENTYAFSCAKAISGVKRAVKRNASRALSFLRGVGSYRPSSECKSDTGYSPREKEIRRSPSEWMDLLGLSVNAQGVVEEMGRPAGI